MFDSYARKLLTVTLVCAATIASAQNSNKENDPYSRYGIGAPLTGTNILLRGMGYAATAFQNSAAINTDNPASYASLKITTYEGGFTGSVKNIKIENRTYGTGSASLSYLRVGIPVSNRAGIAFGIQPQSHVFYHSIDSSGSLVIERSNGDTMFANRTVSDYNGEGGTNYAFLGGGGSIKAFSFGVNIGYMFGNIRNTSRLLNVDSTSILGTDYSSYTRYGSFYWKAGVQYHDTLASGLHLRLGATMALSQNLRGERESYGSSIYTVGTSEYPDTAYHTTGERGDVILPAAYSFGAQLSSGKWSVAADATLTDWSTYSNYGVGDSANEIKDNTLRINAGGEYTPDPTSVYSYMSRVTYRLGLYYGTDYVRLRNTDMNYYGLTLGASMPFKRSPDRIHAAFEIGRRGTTDNGLVQSNFYKFHLGISLNDKWFIKRRYD